MNSRLLVFTKAPVPGTVKTRMISRLGEGGAARLHEQMVIHTLEQAEQSTVDPIELWCAPTTDHPFFQSLRERFSLSLKKQEGEDLGERLDHAIGSQKNSGRSVIVIGTDCPTLSSTLLLEAAEHLLFSDAVIAPAFDGGYVLLGLNRYDALLFREIDWGSDQVFRQTCDRIRTLGWKWGRLPAQPDLDRPEDLDALKEKVASIPYFLKGF